MTPAFALLKFVSFRPRDEAGHSTGQASIHDRFITVREEVPNNYADNATLPAGTIIKMDFGGDFGFYGMADLDGVLTKCRVEINQLHKLDWSPFQSEIDELCGEAA